MENNKKTIFSGIQPSGIVHIGNYLGAIQQWVAMQETYNSIFCVVDYHAITVKQDPEELRKNIINTARVYLASGIHPEKAAIFQQSDISAHAELAWILNCVAARISDLNKMTQFKDKAGKNQNNVSAGLYDYPVLMAADIILYGTDVVPVGEDQKQHVELARDLAKRFNHNYGEVFKIPEVKVEKAGARIMGLDDPTKKMSKSAASANFIALTDAPEAAAKKIMRAVTDADGVIRYDKEKKPGVSNLLSIYSAVSGYSIKELEAKYKGKGYGDLKKDLAKITGEFLAQFQKKLRGFKDEEVREILRNGAKKIRPIAEERLRKAKKAIGVI